MRSILATGYFCGVSSFAVSSVMFIILFGLGLVDGVTESFGAHNPVAVVLNSIIIAPLHEEYLFRLLPIWTTEVILERKGISGKSAKYFMYPVIIASSALFGFLHGGFFNIFIQGISGLILALAFLRAGYFAAVLAHALHNALVWAIVMVDDLTLHGGLFP